eukprot:GCRY01005097.1.p1 GENE.GCRY01005097.1~~GCRY01005097.1.p1  ORF type:complete len:295 (-),score=75.32 GCRY01005097.1:7-852(-)
MNPSVQTLLKEKGYDHLFTFDQERGKLHCSATDHDVKNDLKEVEKYLQGKKFLYQVNFYSHDFSKYEPYIVQSKKHEKQLFCHLTKKSLNKIPEQVEAHVSGKHYQRLFAEAEKKRLRKEQLKAETEQKKEIDEEDFDIWVPDDYLEESAQMQPGSENNAIESDLEEEELSDLEVVPAYEDMARKEDSKENSESDEEFYLSAKRRYLKKEIVEDAETKAFDVEPTLKKPNKKTKKGTKKSQSLPAKQVETTAEQAPAKPKKTKKIIVKKVVKRKVVRPKAE